MKMVLKDLSNCINYKIETKKTRNFLSNVLLVALALKDDQNVSIIYTTKTCS